MVIFHTNGCNFGHNQQSVWNGVLAVYVSLAHGKIKFSALHANNRLPKCHGLLAGPFSLPQRKPVKWGKLDMKFVQETH